MQSSLKPVSITDKTVSLLSYYSMGIVGLVWLIISKIFKKKSSFFLMYNIAQSMLISIFLAFLSLLIKIILQIIIAIPIISSIGISINMHLQEKISVFGLSLNFIQLLVFLLFIYISTGILFGRIFCIPLFTKLMRTVMNSYK